MGKKFGKVLVFLVILALLGGSAYFTCDYMQNPAEYDALVTKLQDKMTGGDQVPIEEVSPGKTVTLSRSLENSGLPYTPYLCSPWEFFGNQDPLVLCYGKDIGGDLPIPVVKNAAYTLELRRLQIRMPNNAMTDVTAFTEPQYENSCILLQQQALRDLPEGEYFLLADYLTSEGETQYYSYGLMLTEQTTFNSDQRGLLNIATEGNWIMNDLEDPSDITFTLINPGDDPVRAVTEGNSPIDPANYTISPRGDQVTLKKEYLSTSRLGSMSVYGFRLASGETLSMREEMVATVKGDSIERLTYQGENTYSHRAGGDFRVPFDPGDASRIMMVKLADFGIDDGLIFEDRLPKGQGSAHIDVENMVVIIPGDEMQALIPQKAPYCITVGYLYQDSFWTQDDFLFYVTD